MAIPHIVLPRYLLDTIMLVLTSAETLLSNRTAPTREFSEELNTLITFIKELPEDLTPE